MSSDTEDCRAGECQRCGTRFIWTGLIATVPTCQCGRKSERHEFAAASIYGNIADQMSADGDTRMRRLGRRLD